MSHGHNLVMPNSLASLHLFFNKVLLLYFLKLDFLFYVPIIS